MALKETLQKTGGLNKKYDYYKALGYSDEAASVLACFAYGNFAIAKFAKELGEEDVLKKFYDYVGDKDPEEAKKEIYEKYYRAMNEDASAFGARPMRGRGAIRASRHVEESGAIDGMVAMESVAMESRMAPLGMSMAKMGAPAAGGMAELKQMAENLATDSYEQIEEKDAKGVFTAPTSTFRMTTTTASMGIVMNQIRRDRKIDMSQVRIEEVLNYFDYDTKAPEEDVFAIETEILDKNGQKKLFYINAQAKHEVKEHQNIILLLDVSGSMGSNAEVTQMAIATIVSKLKEGDIISLVTYSSKDETVFKNYAIRNDSDKEYIMGRIMQTEITGCTFGSAGIETAYEIGKKNYDKDWNNQVILITDGDLNFGITEKGGLKDLIEEKKKENLFLSVIGTGLWNYQDDKLEVLSKHGNGTYCVINDLEDVNESINKHYESLTNIVAKDVKAQVEFNPKYVKEYRLLGYENRELNHEDFVNDKVISEPYGSGGHGVALYELTMNDGSAADNGLKYQTATINDSDELCTVKLRYKEPLADESHEIEHVVKMAETETKNAKLAYLLYCVSEKLRGSDKLDEDDEKYLKEAIAKNGDEQLTELNGDKLKSFIEAYTKQVK